MTRTKEIFTKIKEGHPLWKRGSDIYKDRLERAFEPFFIELEELGVARHFTQALLFYGAEFVDSLEIKDMGRLEPIEQGELIWGVNREKRSDKSIREAELAEKSGALAYRSMPMKDGKVGIDILTYKKK